MNIFNHIRSAHWRTKFFISLSISSIAWLFWPIDEMRPLLQAPMPSILESQSCIELRPQDDTFQETAVWDAGRYCVAIDFWQRRFCGAGHCAPAAYRHLLDIGGGNVNIDLKNHTLHSDGHSSGVIAYTQQNRNSVQQDEPNFLFTQHTRKITIENGVIDLRGVGVGIEFINLWHMLFIDTDVPGSLKKYEKTEFILNNLRIITDGTGIIMEGDGNIVRNCIIESAGRAGIMMAGPNGLIENNTIILTDKIMLRLRPFTLNKLMDGIYNPMHIYRNFKERLVPKAAIVLHQATGTIISGNRIEVKGKSATRHNIYLTDGSSDVRIEGNTFVGSDDPTNLVKDSTAILKSNVFEQGRSWWKF